MRLSHWYRDLRERLRALERRLPRIGLRRRIRRYARMGAAFVLTLCLLAAVSVVFVAARSGIALPSPQTALEIEPGRSAALQAVERIFALSADDESAVDDTRLFAPEGRARRERALQQSAEEAALSFLGVVDVIRGSQAPALIELRALLEAPPPLDRSRTREALSRLAAAVARGDVRLRAARASVAALAEERLERRTADLARHVALGRAGLLSDDSEAAFYRARGEAYAWALLLRGASADDGGQTAALAGLDRAAAYQPLFIFNAARDASALPNHLAFLALDLSEAAAALRAEAMQ